MVSYNVITPAGQSNTASTHFPPLRNSAPDKAFEKMNVQLQCTLRHSLTAVMRLEALKTHGSEAPPRSRLPGNCCYATVESPIKVQRVAR